MSLLIYVLYDNNIIYKTAQGIFCCGRFDGEWSEMVMRYINHYCYYYHALTRSLLYSI